ncbi:unnamed protein product [Sphagnum troendelagicum]|uniref:Uncharacterized protein n=1 Tax=Sphagnum troendelagicum TaxID=128251 RepID=A0ABP0UPB4_9BRYO
MAPEDMRKTALITKSGLYDWTVMSFDLKNATSTFTQTMSEASTKFSPFMILTGRTLRLRADNYLHAMTRVTDESADVEVDAAQFLQKMELIANIHEDVVLNVEQAQKKQRKTYAARKGWLRITLHLLQGVHGGCVWRIMEAHRV